MGGGEDEGEEWEAESGCRRLNYSSGRDYEVWRCCLATGQELAPLDLIGWELRKLTRGAISLGDTCTGLDYY